MCYSLSVMKSKNQKEQNSTAAAPDPLAAVSDPPAAAALPRTARLSGFDISKCRLDFRSILFPPTSDEKEPSLCKLKAMPFDFLV